MRLQDLIADYVDFRRAMGHKLISGNERLQAFCRAVGSADPRMLAQLLERLLNRSDLERAAIASYKEGGLGGFGVTGFTPQRGISHQG